jgi:hypothetical protein
MRLGLARIVADNRRMRTALTVIAGAVAFAGCSDTKRAERSAAPIRCRAESRVVGSSAGGGVLISCREGRVRLHSTARSLGLSPVQTPRFNVPRYRTGGAYPRVTTPTNLDLRRINAALREAVRSDQRAYAPSARSQARSAPQRYYGTYRTAIDRRLVSASTVVVSALIPALKLYPGGNDGSFWISATVRVPTGTRVAMSDLFKDPKMGLRIVAAATKRAVVSNDACVRGSLASERRLHINYDNQGFSATKKNYRHFALTPRGLAIGLDLGQVGAPSCNKIAVIVPYSLVLPSLSHLGARLVAGVRSAG